jgi:hypothetical protein
MMMVKPMVRKDPAASQHGRIRVAVVGGLSRGAEQWSRAADAAGLEVEHHDGRTAGRGSQAIVAAVRRAQVVVIITEPNSHAGVAVARRAAIAAARPHLLIKRLRPQGLSELLADALAAARDTPARS